MAVKEESLGKVLAANRMDAMLGVVAKRLSEIDVGLRPKKPDTTKVTALMDKSKKPAEYFLVLNGTRLRLEIRAGGVNFPLGDMDLGAEKDVVSRRASLEKLKKHTTLVGSADLAAFDKANPAPADPKKLAELRAKVDERANKLKLLRTTRESKTYNSASYDGMDKASADEFEAWATSKRYDRFLEFIGSVDRPDPAGFVIAKFLKKGAERSVDLPAPMVAKIESMHSATGGGKVDFAPARRAVMAKINGFILAPYNVEKKAELQKQIAAIETELKPLLAQLKLMTGR